MIQTVCIGGGGTMGSGIAQLSAQSGLSTIVFDIDEPALTRSKQRIEKSLHHLLEKGKLDTAAKQDILQRIQFTRDINRCRADLLIEAIVERIEPKVAFFKQVMAINGNTSLYATNTSSLAVTEIAAQVKYPDRLVGIHFFNPAPVMKLVEVVKTKYTVRAVIVTATDFAKQMGKTPVVCKDSPGFIVNRVARPYYLESLRLVEEGHADFEQVDRLLEASGFRMGPFRLMDLIGNDINYATSCSVFELLNQPERLRPSPIQKEKTEKGELGRKSGKGYYDYGNRPAE